MSNTLIQKNNTSDSERKVRVRDKYRMADSEWVAGFSCAHLKVLIVCRGPIRKEAMDVFADLGAGYGILLSEKDSVTYPNTLAPELRVIKDQSRIHRIADYTGASGEERKARIAQIINIAKENGYTHIFAGYGFMAEDAEFVEAIEKAGVGFIGPASHVHHAAGAKDAAKKLARKIGVSVTPGVDNITSLTLLKKAGDVNGLKKLAEKNNFSISNPSSDAEEYAEQILEAGYANGVGLITTEEIQAEARSICEKLFKENPGARFRFKYIGGGGGKGQRIISSVSEVNNAVVEVLQESKAMGEADNKNFLIELNIETTRHNEIQLLGNGEWSIALGGRDCSVQMHEQKLLEISLTDELFAHEIEHAKKEGQDSYVATLTKDRQTLKDMEDQAEKFGLAVNLNSASTFECIVSGDSFYFMEMNTRIQVEHRVTEMVYSLCFVNPHNDNDFFIVESLVEAMALIAAHGKRLPRPYRQVNNKSGAEIRLNATNDALQPHAGGVIEFWSSPVEHEVRDDQGICIRNPDTGWFIKYHLAGAYDSNIALLVTYGHGRRENFDRLSNILRQTELRGIDLNTNLHFHYGLLNFCLGLHPMVKPGTRFVLPYLTAVGSLAKQMESFDIDYAWSELTKDISAKLGAEAEKALTPKLTLVTRPLRVFLSRPHVMMGWLILNHRRAFVVENNKVIWKHNPLRILFDLYHFLRLEDRADTPPSQKIWWHDQELLNTGLAFYDELKKRLGIDSEKEYETALRSSKENKSDAWQKFDSSMRSANNPYKDKLSDDLFASCRAAHQGWQLGMEMLSAFIMLGERSGVLKFHVDSELRPVIPEEFNKPENQKEFLKALSPPPPASSDTIVAVSGGMFYARETPASPRYLDAGTHFSVGQPIYIIEVMKMFNKIHAEFSGTVNECLIPESEAGVVVRKGQPLFKVTPDEKIHIETEEEKNSRKKAFTKELLSTVK